MAEVFDVVIVGGGPAGAAAAITLSRYTTRRVALVERSDFAAYRAGESVAPSIFPLLAYLGLERDQLEQAHLPAYAHAAAWGSRELRVRDLLFTGQGNGLHLDRKAFDWLLLREAEKQGTRVFQPATITDVARPADWQLQLEHDGQPIALTARYLIDCSGKNALIVKKKGCRVHKEDNLVALYAYYPAARQATERRTLVETTPDGWYYQTPLPDNKLAVAFITDADILKQLRLNDPGCWQAYGRQTTHIAQTLAALPAPEQFRPYAIHSRVALLPGNENWTAAGDAASSFDPISALGIGHAISSGINSARVADSYLLGDHDTGAAYSRFVLAHFERYLQMRHGFYSAEQRWEDAPFWQKRALAKV